MFDIVFLDTKTLGDTSLETISSLGNCTFYETTSNEQTLQRVKEASVVITNKVVIDKNIIDNCPNLKLICVAATGMNNIDLEYAKQKNIVVKNAVGYSTNSVTQHTFSVLFYLISHSKYFDNFIKSGEYEKSLIFTHLDKSFSELSGKTWGIIGLGTIGKAVAKVAKAFGCEIIYYSTSGKNNDNNFKQVLLKELLTKSDIVSIHAPLNEATKDLLKLEELKLLKDNAVLLNLGRGGIINEFDLATILEQKNIFVGLDVLEAEPIAKNSPLNKIKNLDNVYITPHIAWASVEARDELVRQIVSEVLRFKGSGLRILDES
jgi:glycerate dehydrogenase